MIFTFYSYKGGVGRSMALANLAELFCQEGLNVLMVDWDLEAPGFERYFPVNQDDVLNNRGLLDLILSYKDLMSQELKEDEPLNLEDPEEILIDIYPKGKQKGKLQLLTAGQRLGDKFSNYSQSVVSFDWKDFYENWEGERYFEWLRSKFG
jgi:cellulose biosynthesis protein BcsQ